MHDTSATNPNPGIVECQLEDAHGRRWSFLEKTAIISKEHLDAQTYPQEGVIAGEVVQRSLDISGREVIHIDTERPWHIESIEGATQFDVSPDLLVEW